MQLADFKEKLRAEKLSHSYAFLEDWYGVNRYYLWNLLNLDGYTPPEWAQEKLGIQIYRPAPVCPNCGEVHLIKGVCPTVTPIRIVRQRPRKYPDLFSMPPDYLRQLLDNREDLTISI
jgi:hypothetical protein